MEIKGTKKADVLAGGAGEDTIKGGKGDDVLIGAGGADILKGGKGRDTFIVSDFDHIRDYQEGRDTIVLDPDLSVERYGTYYDTEGGTLSVVYAAPGETELTHIPMVQFEPGTALDSFDVIMLNS